MERRHRIAILLAILAVCVAGLAWRFRILRKGEPRLVTVAGESAILPKKTYAIATARLATTARRVSVAGRDRSFQLVTPRILAPGRAYPLVLVLHGDGGDAAGFHAAMPFERASGEDAILAYPDGLRRTWDLETTSDNPDVAFLAAIVDALAGELPVDRREVFAFGYSSGGFVANVTACQRPGLLRAISSSAGGAPYGQKESWPNGYPRCPGQGPVAAIVLHSRDDFGVTFDSGKFDAMYWAYVNGCDEGEMETTGYSECRAYRRCNPGKPVAFCDLTGVGHWVWDRAPEASWTFFRALP